MTGASLRLLLLVLGGPSLLTSRLSPSSTSLHGGGHYLAAAGLGGDRFDPYEGVCDVDALPAGASPFGLLGMGGNVREWVRDPFTVTPANVRARHPKATVRIARGGWRDLFAEGK